tara:strand:- start:84 stop:827 length:744 start_codon:yes stop_codon:yes gene_type:complete
MTLIATGDNLRNRAMLGLQYMSEEEAEREAIRQQMLMQEKAQRAALAGQIGGIGGAAVVNRYSDEIGSGIRNMLGMGAQPPELSALTPAERTELSQQLGSPITQQSTSQALSAAGSPAYQAQVADLLGRSSAITGQALTSQAAPQVLGQGLNAAAAVSPEIAAAAGSAAPSAGSITLGGTTTSLSAAAPAAQAASGAAATGAAAGKSAAAVQGAVATPPAGSLTLAKIAPPLAIGLGAFFLLNALFD